MSATLKTVAESSQRVYHQTYRLWSEWCESAANMFSYCVQPPLNEGTNTIRFELARDGTNLVYTWKFIHHASAVE